jgi:hypothetical protein
LDRFVACFGRVVSDLYCTGSVGAGTLAEFGTERSQVLCPGELGRLDLTVEAGPDTPRGNYAGSLRIEAKTHTAACGGP